MVSVLLFQGGKKLTLSLLGNILRGFYQTNQYIMKDLTINLVAELEVKYVPKRGRKPYGEIRTSNDAFKILYPLFNPDTIRLQEQFIVLYLNNACAVIGYFNCSKGGTTATCV